MHGNTCSPYGRRSSRVFLHFFSRDPDLENVSPIPGGEGRVESGAESREEFGRKPVSRRDNAFWKASDCLDSKKLTYNGLLRSNKEYSRLESIRSKEYLIHNYYWWREKLRYTSNCEYFLLLLVDDDNYGANFWSLYRRNIWWISLLTIDWNKHIACCMLRWIPSVATSPWNLRLPATGPGNLYLKSRKCYTLHTWPIITRKYEAN